MLSVSGARGLVGRSMTPEVAARFAGSFGSHLRETTDRPRVVIGRDGRQSGEALSRAASGALMAAGCDVTDVGVVATPTVAVAIRTHRAQGGLVVTASHNPIEWNGLKALNGDGLAPGPEVADKIINRFRSGPVDWVGPTGAGSIVRDHEANTHHVDRVLAQLDVQLIRAAHLRVVLDSVNGGGAQSGRMLLESLGCDVIQLNGEQSGIFAHIPEPLEENLGQLCRAIAADHASVVGFAQDPDADRLVIVDEVGRFIGEECTLALAARRVLERSGSGAFATNLSTSRMIDDIVAQHPGSRVIRTAVGEANVVAGMREHHAILGGEGNGGVILPGVCWVRDSLSGMGLILELIAASRKSISTLATELPRYSMVKRKLDLAKAGGRGALDVALRRVREAFSNERQNLGDGLRIDFANGWAHLRASNTEPVVRIIAEAASIEDANTLCDHIANVAGL